MKFRFRNGRKKEVAPHYPCVGHHIQRLEMSLGQIGRPGAHDCRYRPDGAEDKRANGFGPLGKCGKAHASIEREGPLRGRCRVFCDSGKVSLSKSPLNVINA